MGLDLSKGKSANMIKDIAVKSVEESGKKTTKNINIDLIDMNEDNDKIFNCDDLASLQTAIERNGFQGTIEVFAQKNGRYGLLSGHRRYLSAKNLGYKEIPCEIVAEPSEIQKAEILIMSNIVARDLTPVEKGKALVYYEENVLKKDKGFKGDRRAELGKRFGIASSQVYKLKALVNLIPELQKLVEDETVTYASIYVCANLSEDVQLKIYNEIVSEMSFSNQIKGSDVTLIVNKYINPVEEEKKIDTVQEVVTNSEPIDEYQQPFPNRRTAEELTAPEESKPINPIDIEYQKEKPLSDMSFVEQRIFLACENIMNLMIKETNKEVIKVTNPKLIDEINKLKSFLDSI